MVTAIKQGDPRWKSARIGKSVTNVGRHGCTISACCMALEKLRGSFCDPKSAAYYWKFNLRGEILWDKTDFKGMKFAWRGYGFKSDKIKEYANTAGKAAILEVNHGAHWVYVEEVTGGGLRDMKIIDPIDGKVYDSLPGHYKPTGFALFERSEVPIPEWMKEFYVKAVSRGMKETDPLTPATIEKIEEILFDMGVIAKKEGNITIGRFTVIMQKIKESW